MRSHTWYDWVFVNLDGKAPSFETYIAEATAHFDGYDLSALRRERHIITEFACNWKLAFENAHDVYHVFKVHPQLDRMVPEARWSFEIAGHHLLNHYPMSAEGHGLIPESDTPALPALPVAKCIFTRFTRLPRCA